MRTYRAAHALAALGHEVHVVTNAKEVRPPFRMYMRREDWKRCEARYGPGSVQVHWTDPVDRSQSYIPMTSPFVTKLAAITARVHSEHPLDVIYSHYLEPYGVAAHLAAQMTGVPHVARMAGSDAGRLWHHPQFEALYDHVLRSAEIVIAAGTVAERAVEHGIDPERIAHGGQFLVPDDLFTPDGPVLDLATLRAEVAMDPDLRDLTWGEFAGDRPYFGICGKLGENKGSFALLGAMHLLKRAGLEVGLVALAHGQPAVERSFRVRARKLGLAGNILQIPFLPHWRVPEFLRGCLAVCCLEQDFPIGFHTPMIPFETLLCGACLVASTEVIAKLPTYGRLPDGYGCVAIEDVNDISALSSRLAAIVRDPKPAAIMGARGRTFARDLQTDADFPRTLERVLEATARRQPISRDGKKPSIDIGADTPECHFRFAQLAEAELRKKGQMWGLNATFPQRSMIDLKGAQDVLAALQRGIEAGQPDLESLASAVKVEVAVAAAESEIEEIELSRSPAALFRLRTRRWAMDDSDLAALVPWRDPGIRLLEFDHDLSGLLEATTATDISQHPTPLRSHIVAFAQAHGKRRSPLIVDAFTARILELSDGTRTAAEIVRELDPQADSSTMKDELSWIENLFVGGLLNLRDSSADIEMDERV
jgi:glycosyltransferase involved in cell wall biosynthesis